MFRGSFTLETKDGKALLGYAGLGSTAMGNEPSDWMANTVRGLNLPLEQVLNVLAEAAKKELPSHLQRLSLTGVPSHNIIVPAFIDDHPRIYSIDLSLEKSTNILNFRYTRHVTGKKNSKGELCPRIAIAGSGAQYIYKDKKWQKNLLKIISAHEREKVSAQEVAKHFAKLNFRVAEIDKFVSKECVVIWRHKDGGGSEENYSGLVKDSVSQYKTIPTIASGMDVSAVVNVLMPYFKRSSEDFFKYGKMTDELYTEKINRDLAKLPGGPDDKLI